MAETRYTPTPPFVPVEGPIRDIVLPSLVSSDSFVIDAGWLHSIRQYWTVIGAYFQLVADANVGNRYIQFKQYKDKITQLHQLGIHSGAIAAGETKRFEIGPFTFASGAAYYADTNAGLGGNSWIFMGDEYLKIYVSDAKAGDVLTGQVRLRYANPDLGVLTPYEYIKGLLRRG